MKSSFEIELIECNDEKRKKTSTKNDEAPQGKGRAHHSEFARLINSGSREGVKGKVLEKLESQFKCKFLKAEVDIWGWAVNKSEESKVDYYSGRMDAIAFRQHQSQAQVLVVDWKTTTKTDVLDLVNWWRKAEKFGPPLYQCLVYRELLAEHLENNGVDVLVGIMLVPFHQSLPELLMPGCCIDFTKMEKQGLLDGIKKYRWFSNANESKSPPESEEMILWRHINYPRVNNESPPESDEETIPWRHINYARAINESPPESDEETILWRHLNYPRVINESPPESDEETIPWRHLNYARVINESPPESDEETIPWRHIHDARAINESPPESDGETIPRRHINYPRAVNESPPESDDQTIPWRHINYARVINESPPESDKGTIQWRHINYPRAINESPLESEKDMIPWRHIKHARVIDESLPESDKETILCLKNMFLFFLLISFVLYILVT